MKLERTTKDGRPAYRGGDGKVYTYKAGDKDSRNAAKKRALRSRSKDRAQRSRK